MVAGSGSASGTELVDTATSSHGRGDNLAIGSFINLVFGQVPSRFEVINAISALHSFMQGTSSSGSTVNWFHQKFGNDGPRILQSPGFRLLFDAFMLLKTESAFLRLVVSLATDKAVWDAVLKNKVVRKLRESLLNPVIHAGEGERLLSYDNEQDLATHFIRWILDIAKEKVMELIDSFIDLFNDIFQSPGMARAPAEANDELNEKVGSSLLLSIVIFLVVVVTRVKMV